MYTVDMNSIQYTVRNIPPKVDKALRNRAKKQGKSFNQTVVDALKKAVGVDKDTKEYHDLDWFIGSGGISPEAEAAFKEQRVIDEELWR